MAKAKSKVRTPNRGRQAIVGRFFRGLPVLEATEPLRITVLREDIGKATRLDPNKCVFAQACKRLFDSHAVLFLRRRAYVELPDSRGRRVVFRYIIDNEMLEKIVTFDKTGVAPEGGFVLQPPSVSMTIEAHTKYWKAHKAALRAGTKKRGPSRGPSRTRAKAMSLVRDGRGKLGINYAF